MHLTLLKNWGEKEDLRLNKNFKKAIGSSGEWPVGNSGALVYLLHSFIGWRLTLECLLCSPVWKGKGFQSTAAGASDFTSHRRFIFVTTTLKEWLYFFPAYFLFVYFILLYFFNYFCWNVVSQIRYTIFLFLFFLILEDVYLKLRTTKQGRAGKMSLGWSALAH